MLNIHSGFCLVYETHWYAFKKNYLLQGYLQKVREDDLFTANDSEVIFGNIEQLYTFHKEFVLDLQCCIDHSAMENSCVGETFLKHVNFLFVFLFLVTSLKFRFVKLYSFHLNPI